MPKSISVSNEKSRTVHDLKWIELILIFIAVPLILAMPVSLVVKVVSVLVALAYVVMVSHKDLKQTNELSRKVRKTRFRSLITLIKTSIKQSDIKRLVVLFILFSLASTAYVLLVMPANAFIVILHAPQLWLGIVFVYLFVSVLPQEALYRAFFMQRYSSLFSKSQTLTNKEKTKLIVVNASLFSLAHLFFFNTLVLVLTFCGGLLFAFTYLRHSSAKVGFVLVSIEHAFYGLWLFTVGMGEMLAFPMPTL